MMDNLSMEKKMELEFRFRLMVPNMMGNGKIIILKGMENTLGLMEDNIWENGLKVNCMDMVFILGKMGEYIKDIIGMIKNMGMEFTNGQTAKFMMVGGLMVNNTEKELSQTQ